MEFKVKTIYEVKVDAKEYKFREEIIEGDGDYAFHALGITRKEYTDIVKDTKNVKEFKQELIEEIHV